MRTDLELIFRRPLQRLLGAASVALFLALSLGGCKASTEGAGAGDAEEDVFEEDPPEEPPPPPPPPPPGPAVLEVSESAFDYAVMTHDRAVDRSFLIRNLGATSAGNLQPAPPPIAAPYTFKGGAFPGTGGTCVQGGTIAFYESCTVVISFTPSAASSYGDTVRLEYHDGTGIEELSWTLSGEGTGSLRTLHVVTGRAHSCALLTNHTVRCWGANTSGQLGLGDSAARGDNPNEMQGRNPILNLGTGRKVIKLAAGGDHNCALFDNGGVKCWGANNYGQLGRGSTDLQPRGDSAGETGDGLPYVNLGSGRLARDIAAGAHHSCAVIDDGTLRCWGRNHRGQLGLDDAASRGDGPGEMGSLLPAVFVGTGQRVKTVAAGQHFTCAILESGGLRCWGDNSQGQLGLGHKNHWGDAADEMDGAAPPIVALPPGRTPLRIVAGDLHACALLDDGSLKCWGNNGSGQLGVGDQDARGDDALELPSSDALVPLADLGPGRTAVAIAAGGMQTCAVLDDQSLKCWGANAYGQLGQGDMDPRGDSAGELSALTGVSIAAGKFPISVSAGMDHVCAVLGDRSVKCWGRNQSGQLGLGDTATRGEAGGEMGAALPYVKLGTGALVTKLATGGIGATPCVVVSGGKIKCWGYNFYGQAAIGDTAGANGNIGDSPGEVETRPYVVLAPGDRAKEVAVADLHGCALLDTNQIKCWGYNAYGEAGAELAGNITSLPQLGSALVEAKLGTGRSAVKVGVGSYHTCALLDDATLKCWGYNHVGQCGYADLAAYKGTAPGSLGDNLPPVDLGAGRTVKDFGLFSHHTCAVLDNDRVKCWGYNNYGQLGLGDTNNRGDNAGEMGDSLPYVDLGTGRTAKKVYVGAFNACALLDNDQVKCWGYGYYGYHGLGSAATYGDGANAMGDNLGTVPLGTGRSVVKLAMGYYHACALLDDGQIKCWGYLSNGETGLGVAPLAWGRAPGEMGDMLPALNAGTGRRFVDVMAGAYLTCGLLDDGMLKCFGYNEHGRLGLGHTNSVGAVAGDTGDNIPTVPLGDGD
ncbi:MAG: hypothetical protein IT285_01405 [Bdellovibrionales bacterium]|nr:hypothetical protein [Bdellovibrionales bacterium]